MDYLVLIQARCGSSRLPNKVLMDIAGKPDIQWVIERVKRSKKIDEVMVITSIEKDNIPLIKICSELGLRVFVGAEDDVLDRYYQAAKLIKPKYVIRVTADCPMFDWRYLDQAIEQMEEGTDYMASLTEDFPDGLDFEIVSFSALKKAWGNARLTSEREHVTVYIRNNPEEFSIQRFEYPIKNAGHHRWTLDEERDFEFIKKVYEYFVSNGTENFVTENIIEYLDKHPEVFVLNNNIGRNEGLAKSLAEDKILSEEEVG